MEENEWFTVMTGEGESSVVVFRQINLITRALFFSSDTNTEIDGFYLYRYLYIYDENERQNGKNELKQMYSSGR